MQPFLQPFLQTEVAVWSNKPDITEVFEIRPIGTFIEVKLNLRRIKEDRTNQGTNFIGNSFNNGHNVRIPVQFRRERLSKHLKRRFFIKIVVQQTQTFSYH